MRLLADDLNNDPETSWFFPTYGGIEGRQPSLNTFKSLNDPLSLADWLLACAESLEAGFSSDELSKPLKNRRGVQLKSFVINGVYFWIEHYLAAGRRLGIVNSSRAKNKETALLASALLDENITANDVTQTRQTHRKRYHKQ